MEFGSGDFDKDKTSIIAVSTGVDSMVLLSILKNITSNIVIVHFNHGKREESKLEEEFITKYANNHNIKLHTYKLEFDSNKNFQEEARIKRYELLFKTADEYNTNQIFIAHHGNDNIETILMKILRGSDIFGYKGITSTTSIDNKYTIFRPLINVSKGDIYTYAFDKNIEYFEDKSNNDNTYFRNNIRNSYVTKLVGDYPNSIEKFNKFSSDLFEISSFIEKEACKYIDDKINISIFNSLDIVLKKAIVSISLRDRITLTSTTLDNILSSISSSNNNHTLDIGNGYKLVKEYEYFYFTNTTIVETTVVNIDLTKEETYNINKYDIKISNSFSKSNTNEVVLCYNVRDTRLSVRTRQSGDFIKLSHGSVKLKKLFIDKKIPTTKRDNTLLLVDSIGEILYIFDLDIKSSRFGESDDVYKYINISWR